MELNLKKLGDNAIAKGFEEMGKSILTGGASGIGKYAVGKLFEYIFEKIKNREIREDIFKSQNNRKAFIEVLKYLDNGIPDEYIFDALKVVLTHSYTEEDLVSDKVFQILRILTSLDSNDLRIVFAAYTFYKKLDSSSLEELEGRSYYWYWRDKVYDEAGFEFKETIDTSEEKLINLHLIAPRANSDINQINNVSNFRLTEMAIKMCDYLMEINYTIEKLKE